MTKRAKRSGPSPKKVKPSRVRYIKLGRGGMWESECLANGILRMGFGTGRPGMFRLCADSDWKGVTAAFRADGKTISTATRFTNELKVFFEDPGTVLWISFMYDSLHWGMATADPPRTHEDGGGVWRPLQGGWRNTDVVGTTLSKDRLSGALTKLALFRGTSCDVDVSAYVIRRINGQKVPEVERGLSALQEVSASALEHLVRGRTNKQIAQRLGVAENTVKTQVNRIYEKLEVRNRLDLLTLAIERGWVQESKTGKAPRGG